jgi:hypothetical protein
MRTPDGRFFKPERPEPWTPGAGTATAQMMGQRNPYLPIKPSASVSTGPAKNLTKGR